MQTRAGIKAGQGTAGPHLPRRVGRQGRTMQGSDAQRSPQSGEQPARQGADGERQIEDEGKGADLGCEGRSLEG